MDVLQRFKADVSGSPRGRIVEIANESGVTIKTLRNYYYGYTKDVTHSTARKLADYYARTERRVNPDRRQNEG